MYNAFIEASSLNNKKKFNLKCDYTHFLINLQVIWSHRRITHITHVIFKECWQKN